MSSSGTELWLSLNLPYPWAQDNPPFSSLCPWLGPSDAPAVFWWRVVRGVGTVAACIAIAWAVRRCLKRRRRWIFWSGRLERMRVPPLTMPAIGENDIISPSSSSSCASRHLQSGRKSTTVKVIPSPARPLSSTSDGMRSVGTTSSQEEGLFALETPKESGVFEPRYEEPSLLLPVLPSEPDSVDHTCRLTFQGSLDEEEPTNGTETTQPLELNPGNTGMESDEFNLTFQGSLDGYDSDVEDSDSDTNVETPRSGSNVTSPVRKTLNVSATPAEREGGGRGGGEVLLNEGAGNDGEKSNDIVTSVATIEINN